jgi:phosphopantothenoylcysteine decarboxylase/phosphopantothenate--cysteine ligase
VITAGPTYEPLDNVRRLTNFSTGKLGSELGNFLTARGHDLTVLVGEQATYGGQRNVQRVEMFSTTTDLRTQLEALSRQGVGAVFHAAAVSDFTFGKIWVRTDDNQLKEIKAGKLSTREGNLLAELVPTPKIIAELRKWFPKSVLVGWKYEVDGDRASVIRLAEKQIADCEIDACVANGRAYGEGFGLVRRDGQYRHTRDTAELFEELAGLIET